MFAFLVVKPVVFQNCIYYRCDIRIFNFLKVKNIYVSENFAKFLYFSLIFLIVFSFPRISIISPSSNFVVTLI